jgi:hypothetical protein
MTAPHPQEPLLTAAEVKAKIAACIGGTGQYTFRKWTCDPPVLTQVTLPRCKRPRYLLSQVQSALTDLQPPVAL